MSGGAVPKSKWEQRWEKTAVVAERREIPNEVAERLKKTEEMFVDAPKAAAAAIQPESSSGSAVSARQSGDLIRARGATLTLPVPASLLVTATILAVSVWMGVEFQRRGQEEGKANVVDLPLDSAFLLALMLHILVRSTMRALRVAEPPPVSAGWLSGAAMRMAKMFVPSLVYVTSTLSVVRDCVDDTLTFAVGFGTGSAAARLLHLDDNQGQGSASPGGK